MSDKTVASIKKQLLKRCVQQILCSIGKTTTKKPYERFGGLKELKNVIFKGIHMGYKGPVFWKPKVKEKCTGEVIKEIGRKLHEAGGCDAEDDYSRGYDDAITLALNILLEETGYGIEDIIS